MLNLEKYCISQKPSTDDHIAVFTYTIASSHAQGQKPYVPDMDSVSGALIIKDAANKTIFTFYRLIDNYSLLIEFFHLPKWYDGMFKFYLDYCNSVFEIIIYLYKPLFKKPIYIPNVTAPTQARLELQPNVAKNEQIHIDYNSMFQIDLYNYQQNNVAWMISIEELTATECNVLTYPKLKELSLTRIH